MDPLAEGPGGRGRKARDPAAAGTRRPRGRDEVRCEGPARRPGARVGAGVGRPRRGRRGLQAASARACGIEVAQRRPLRSGACRGRRLPALVRGARAGPRGLASAGDRSRSSRPRWSPRWTRRSGTVTRSAGPSSWGPAACRRGSAPLRAGTASSTDGSARRMLSIPAVKAVELGSALEAARPRLARPRRDRARAGGRPAAPDQPRRGSRGRRHQRRRDPGRRDDEADLDARQRPRLGGPGDRAAARSAYESSDVRRCPRAASSPRPCWRSFSPTRSGDDRRRPMEDVLPARRAPGARPQLHSRAKVTRKP